MTCLVYLFYSRVFACYHEPNEFSVTWVSLVLRLGSEYHMEQFLSAPPFPLMGNFEKKHLAFMDSAEVNKAKLP